MRFAFALLLATGTLWAAPVPKDFRRSGDKDLLVGTWKPADTSSAWFRFRADGTLQTWATDSPQEEIAWLWTDLDTKSTPKRMTLNRRDTDWVFTCPYELSGDTLRLALLSGKDAAVPPAGVHFRQLTRDVAVK